MILDPHRVQTIEKPIQFTRLEFKHLRGSSSASLAEDLHMGRRAGNMSVMRG